MRRPRPPSWNWHSDIILQVLPLSAKIILISLTSIMSARQNRHQFNNHWLIILQWIGKPSKMEIWAIMRKGNLFTTKQEQKTFLLQLVTIKHSWTSNFSKVASFLNLTYRATLGKARNFKPCVKLRCVATGKTGIVSMETSARLLMEGTSCKIASTYPRTTRQSSVRSFMDPSTIAHMARDAPLCTHDRYPLRQSNRWRCHYLSRLVRILQWVDRPEILDRQRWANRQYRQPLKSSPLILTI